MRCGVLALALIVFAGCFVFSRTQRGWTAAARGQALAPWEAGAAGWSQRRRRGHRCAGGVAGIGVVRSVERPALAGTEASWYGGDGGTNTGGNGGTNTGGTGNAGRGTASPPTGTSCPSARDGGCAGGVARSVRHAQRVQQQDRYLPAGLLPQGRLHVSGCVRRWRVQLPGGSRLCVTAP